MGLLASVLGLFAAGNTLNLLSILGITALFLFAGLEINGSELRRDARLLIQHGLLWLGTLVVATVAAVHLFDLSTRASILVALALMTPSTGFILSSLGSFGLLPDERSAVKTKAIGAELLALGLLFFALQSTSWQRLIVAIAAMAALVLIIPLAFRMFAKLVAPYAPRSEFAFLLMVAVLCAYATRWLGVYYLVGAFLVGVAAQRFRERMPAMSSEKMIDALEAFGSVFIPFYFFAAGMHIDHRELGWPALVAGLAFLIVCVPLRIIATSVHRRFVLAETSDKSRRIAIAMVPTLVFTLVLAEILRDRFSAPGYLVGGLIVYTVVNTMIPAFVLHTPPPDFETVTASDVTPESGVDLSPSPDARTSA
jgi:Kef-type K+ transport system membrane component KefB